MAGMIPQSADFAYNICEMIPLSYLARDRRVIGDPCSLDPKNGRIVSEPPKSSFGPWSVAPPKGMKEMGWGRNGG